MGAAAKAAKEKAEAQAAAKAAKAKAEAEAAAKKKDEEAAKAQAEKEAAAKRCVGPAECMGRTEAVCKRMMEKEHKCQWTSKSTATRTPPDTTLETMYTVSSSMVLAFDTT